MIDQEFAKWYINEDWKTLNDAAVDRVKRIADSIEYDMKTNTRPYATRVLLLKENIIPMPPIIDSDVRNYCSLHGLSLKDLYPTDNIIDRLKKQIEREFYGLKYFG